MRQRTDASMPTEFNAANLESILAQLPRLRKMASELQDVLLANLVMLGEINAPSGEEQPRMQLWLQRLAENGAQSCSLDEMGNGCGVLPGRSGKRTILLATNADTLPADASERGIELKADRVSGPFVGDNCPALAALLSLPAFLEHLGWHLQSDVALLGAARSLGRHNLEGIRFFLNNTRLPVQTGIWMEGVQLGRLNYMCLGLFRGEITCRVPDDYNWAQFGATGSILPMNDVIARISQIPLPRRPAAGIVLGSINGGVDYQNIAKQTMLQFEVRSESGELAETLRGQVQDIVDEAAARTGMSIVLREVAFRRPGGLEIAHPLVRNARGIISALGIQPMIYPTTTALSAFVDARIPAVTLGFTSGQRQNESGEMSEWVSIPDMFAGMAQLAAMLAAIDGDSSHAG